MQFLVQWIKSRDAGWTLHLPVRFGWVSCSETERLSWVCGGRDLPGCIVHFVMCGPIVSLLDFLQTGGSSDHHEVPAFLVEDRTVLSALPQYISDIVARSSDICSHLSESPKDAWEGNNSCIRCNQGFSSTTGAILLQRLILPFSTSVLGPTWVSKPLFEGFGSAFPSKCQKIASHCTGVKWLLRLESIYSVSIRSTV